MQPENCLGGVRTVQDPFLDHHDRATVLTSGWSFLRRLEDEFDGSGQHFPVIRQHFGGTHEHGNMGVVTACVHNRHVLAVKFTPCHRGKRNPGPFKDRQSIHIGPQCDYRTWSAANQRTDHTGMCDTGLDLVEAETSQVLGDLRRRSELTIREFRMLMDVAPPCDDFWLYRRECLVQV